MTWWIKKRWSIISRRSRNIFNRSYNCRKIGRQGELPRRLNMELDISKVYLRSMCTAVLIGWDPATLPPPPTFGLMNEGAIGQPRKTTSLCDPLHLPQMFPGYIYMATSLVKFPIILSLLLMYTRVHRSKKSLKKIYWKSPTISLLSSYLGHSPTLPPSAILTTILVFLLSVKQM